MKYIFQISEEQNRKNGKQLSGNLGLRVENKEFSETNYPRAEPRPPKAERAGIKVFAGLFWT